jgi:hypothetical protein
MVEIPATETPSCLEANQRYLAIADSGHHRILIISLQGEIKVSSYLIFVLMIYSCIFIVIKKVEIGGTKPGLENGTFEKTKFHSPQGMAFLPPSSLFVADTGNHSVRLVYNQLLTMNKRTINNLYSFHCLGGLGSKKSADCCWHRSAEYR